MTTLLFYTAEDRLGDALIKLPALLALRQAEPNVSLVWVAGERRSAFSQLLKPLTTGLFDELHEAVGLGTNWIQALVPFWRRSFDVIIASDEHLRNTLALRRISHQRFIAPFSRHFFSDRKPPNRNGELTLYRRTAQLINLALDIDVALRPRLPIPINYVTCATHLLPSGTTYIGFIPGAGGKDKCWPLEHYIAIARMQTARGRQPVFFLGPEELVWYAQIREAVPGVLIPEWDEAANQLRGPTLTIALARYLKVAISNDSGGGHLTCAGGCPVITLIGRTNPDKFESPYGRRHILCARNYGGDEVRMIPVVAVAEMLETLDVDA